MHSEIFIDIFLSCLIVHAKELFPSTISSNFDWIKEITFFVII